MTTKTIQTVNVRGQSIDARAFGTLKNAIGKVDEKLTLAANAATVQAVVFGNWDWLRGLFEVEGMRKVNGELTKRGTEVRDYIKTFAPVNFESKNGELTINGTKNKKNKGLFFTLEKDENGAPVKVDASENPDFPQTLTEWRNAQGGKEGNEPKNKKATTLAAQLEKMAGLIRGESEGVTVTGSAEELAALAQQAMDVANAAALASADAASEADDVDQTRAEELQGVVSSSEKRAG